MTSSLSLDWAVEQLIDGYFQTCGMYTFCNDCTALSVRESRHQGLAIESAGVDRLHKSLLFCFLCFWVAPSSAVYTFYFFIATTLLRSNMRTTLALSALAAVATAADIQCNDRISWGKLDVHKNDIKSGEHIPLTFDASNKLIGSKDGQQYLVEVVPCTSAHIGKPATTVSADKKTVTVVGRILGNNGLCLQRNAQDGSVEAADCVNTDGPEQESQFWSMDLVNHDKADATGSNVSVSCLKADVFHHLAGGKVWESDVKPPHVWHLTFSYLE
ncbi:hypothetical protein BKA62DRAFT_709191 [Auriculariales sp. MPI-PUGE-AT-0066]|nr:hypothetical protein BKA62DRAFT_709191 [Auriculariales sp. MPI-PUGE-AT-0066]